MIRRAYIIGFLMLLSMQLSAQTDTLVTPSSEVDLFPVAGQDTILSDTLIHVLDDSGKLSSEPTVPRPRQIRLSVDLARPVASILMKDRTGIELMFDYYLRNELYLIAEGGGGNVRYHHPDLSYDASNLFFRLGVDKSMLPRIAPEDWDMVFVGARYGMALVQMGATDYATSDPYWGITTGTLPAKRLASHWFEVTGGMRVEMLRGFFVGWNVRGRFLLNRSAMDERAPAYIAGYGKGDKNGIFDFNFYISYALRGQ